MLFCAGIASAQNNTGQREYGNVGASGIKTFESSLEALEIPDPIPDFKSIEDFSTLRYGTTDLDIFNPTIQTKGAAGIKDFGNGFVVTGASSYSEQPFLLVTRSAAMGLNYTNGRFSAYVGGSASNLAPMGFGTVNQFGVDAMLKYRLTPVVSITAFGQYYSNAPYFNAATYGYVNSSRYGAYATFESDRVGVDLGAQRYMDPMTGRWEVAPIVTPFVKINENISIGLPVGGMIKNAYDRAHPHEIPPPPPVAGGNRR